MKITFNGQNASGYVSYGGVTFPCGEAVSVKAGDEPGELSQSWLDRLSNHPEFTVSGKRDPLDHDGDGKKGGSVAPADGLAELRAEYAEKVGKRPFAGWSAEELQRRIAAAEE